MNTYFVPAEKDTLLPVDDVNTVVRSRVFVAAVYVPTPTSHSVAAAVLTMQ
jgi:hypothetical protein